MSEHTNERTETHACDSISRQNAIDTVKKMRAVCDTDSIEDYEALLETAFEALPSAQPKAEERTAEMAQNVPKDDLISRKAAIDAVSNAFDRETLLTGFVRSIAVRAIRDMPTAQLEDYTEMKQEFLRMASYIDVLLECSDVQKETLTGFISRLAELMPWTERD